MIAAIIIIACCVVSALLYICALQLGYLMGKKQGRKDLEDKYWLQNMMIAQYDNEQFKSYIKKTESYDGVGDPYEDGGL